MRYVFSIVFLCIAAVVFSGCSILQKKAKSGLQILITNSVPATVYLDGIYLEKTPLINQNLQPGTYSIKIQPDDPNLVSYETTVTLRPNVLTAVTWKLAERTELSGGTIYEMEPIANKNKAELSFTTIPDGAILTFPDRKKQFAPVLLDDVAAGEFAYETTLPSYEKQQHTIAVVNGYRMLITVKLAKSSLAPEIDSATPTETTPQASDSGAVLGVTAQEASTSGKPKPSIMPPIASGSAVNAQQVLILPTGFFNNGAEVLRVRETPSSLGKELGFAAVGKQYQYLQKTENNWHAIRFEQKTGWVSANYAQLQ